jgi:hypothetical protein
MSPQPYHSPLVHLRQLIRGGRGAAAIHGCGMLDVREAKQGRLSQPA